MSEPDPSGLLVLDTHVLVWMVSNGPRLGVATARALDKASLEERLRVSAITPWEIAMLVSRGRLTLNADVMDWIGEALDLPGVRVAPLEPEIAIASTRLPFAMRPDPADRMLVATARRMGATLVTADEALLALAARGDFRAMDARE